MPTFNIGLVMAGAVSAGAYTAGAVDFLLQALDEWYAAKSSEAVDVPTHDVSLKVMAGASAGGMTAAITAAVINEVLPPADDYPAFTNGAANKLFDTWVNRVDIEGLLGHADLDADAGSVRSLLDSTVLDRSGTRLFQPGQPRAARRPYVADPLMVAVTLTNLRGVPYKIDFQGLMSARLPYVMTLHADAMTFAIRQPTIAAMETASGQDTVRNAVPLNAGEVGAGEWPLLRDAALATGAFPLGLAPRALNRLSSVYAAREWYFPHPRTVDGVHRCGSVDYLDPFWESSPPFRYDFLCVDGGTMDNEPVGLARGLLTPRDPFGTDTAHEAAPSALVMIDPFPDAAPYDAADDFHASYTLLKLGPKVLRSLINQARFKPEELTRAADLDVYNQFLLVPARFDRNGKRVPTNPIASGGLGGFAGFLSREFRAHDFQLGRMNCQHFLRRHFVLPEILSTGTPNPLFADWPSAARDAFRVRRDAAGRVVEKDDTVVDETGNRVAPQAPVRDFLPIVPLFGRAHPDVQSPDWPKYPPAALRKLRGQITDRAKRVVERLIADVRGSTTKFLLRRAWWLKRDDLIEEYVMGPVTRDLVARGLLRD